MEIAIGNYYIDKYGLSEGGAKMAEDGYTAIDFKLSDTNSEYYAIRDEDFVRRMYEIKNTLKKCGVRVHQVHGPWPVAVATEDERAVAFSKMTKAMVMAKHMGAGYMAIHPLMPYGVNSAEKPEEVYEINKSYYTSLASVAAALGVVICIENMPFPDFPLSSSASVYALVKDIGSPNVKMCFDTGHAHIMGEPFGEALRAIADEVRIIHVHDNDGVEDMHLNPYDGNADMSDLAEALFDIGYSGVFSLETKPMACDGENADDAEKRLAGLARLIAG